MDRREAESRLERLLQIICDTEPHINANTRLVPVKHSNNFDSQYQQRQELKSGHAPIFSGCLRRKIEKVKRARLRLLGAIVWASLPGSPCPATIPGQSKPLWAAESQPFSRRIEENWGELSLNPFQGESNWGLNPFLVRQGSCLVVKVQTSDSMSKILGKLSVKSYFFLSDRFIQGRITLNEFKTHSSRCQKSDCLLFSLFRTLKNKLMSMRLPHWTMFPIHQQQEIFNLWR